MLNLFMALRSRFERYVGMAAIYISQYPFILSFLPLLCSFHTKIKYFKSDFKTGRFFESARPNRDMT